MFKLVVEEELIAVIYITALQRRREGKQIRRKEKDPQGESFLLGLAP